MAQTTSGGVIDVLQSQHEQVKKLLSQIGSGKGASAADDFCALHHKLAVHETAEEEIVYPALRSTGPDGERVVKARIAEEEKGVKVLTQLEGLEVGSAEFTKVFDKFHKAVLEHASAEESEVFPLLASTQTPEQLQRMAHAFQTAEAAAPTHGHPHDGKTGAGKSIDQPASKIAEQVRGALRKAS
jgi:hemerythrin superfamily protein